MNQSGPLSPGHYREGMVGQQNTNAQGSTPLPTMYGTKRYQVLRLHLHGLKQKLSPDTHERMDNVINNFREEAKTLPNTNAGFQQLLFCYERFLLPILTPAQKQDMQRILQTLRDRLARSKAGASVVPPSTDNTADSTRIQQPALSQRERHQGSKRLYEKEEEKRAVEVRDGMNQTGRYPFRYGGEQDSNEVYRVPQAAGSTDEVEIIDLTQSSDVEMVPYRVGKAPRFFKRPRPDQGALPPPEAAMQSSVALSQPGMGPKCGICWETMNTDGKSLLAGPCGHVYCKDCLLAAVKTNKKCPTCRKTLQVRQLRPIYLNFS